MKIKMRLRVGKSVEKVNYKQGFIARIKCRQQALQLVIKMSVFNEINDSL